MLNLFFLSIIKCIYLFATTKLSFHGTLNIFAYIDLHLSFFKTKQVYVNIKDDRAHAVNTAWAMLALIYAGQVQTA